MSLGNIGKFIGDLDIDENLAKLFGAAETEAEKFAVAKDAGYEFTIEEFRQGWQSFCKKAKEEGAVPESELDKVAGGGLSGQCSSIKDGW